MRLVRTAAGVAADSSGRAEGRGAYLCPDPACWRLAQRKRSLERALGARLQGEDWARLWSGILEPS